MRFHVLTCLNAITSLTFPMVINHTSQSGGARFSTSSDDPTAGICEHDNKLSRFWNQSIFCRAELLLTERRTYFLQ
jgi:hypothetical protein